MADRGAPNAPPQALPAGRVELLVKDHLLFKCADRAAYHLAHVGKTIGLSPHDAFSTKVSELCVFYPHPAPSLFSPDTSSSSPRITSTCTCPRCHSGRGKPSCPVNHAFTLPLFSGRKDRPRRGVQCARGNQYSEHFLQEPRGFFAAYQVCKCAVRSVLLGLLCCELINESVVLQESHCRPTGPTFLTH